VVDHIDLLNTVGRMAPGILPKKRKSPLLVLIFGVAASYLPAWRATRVDPVEALPHE
jgi:hypothetical protein